MSRIGKMPIPVPKGVTVALEGDLVKVKGPKGELAERIRPEVSVEIEESEVRVLRKSEDRKSRGFHGLYRNLIRNMVVGVSEGYTRTLLINGVGFRAEVNKNVVTLNLGYSNPVDYVLPDGVTVEAASPTKIAVKGYSKHLVGKVASEIRGLRPPEPYKGKGVKYENETIRRKVGKTGV